MPLQFCHPNTPHRKLAIPEWFVSNLMMDRALDAVWHVAVDIDRLAVLAVAGEIGDVMLAGFRRCGICDLNDLHDANVVRDAQAARARLRENRAK